LTPIEIEMLPEGDLPEQPLTPEPSFASSLPDDANGFLDVPLTQTPPDSFLSGEPAEALPPPERKKRLKMSRAMKKTMEGLKEKVADLPIMWFQEQAVEHPEWALSDREQEWLRESINTVFETLDIELEVQPLSVQLTSIWWVLGYPFVTFLFLFLIKKGKTLQGEQND
jgi:hypothetical protein